MPAWNELHYQRAQEFAQLVASAAYSAAASRPTAHAANAPTPFAAPVAASAATATRPPVPAPATPAPAAPPAAPTAGSVLNKIPWKK